MAALLLFSGLAAGGSPLLPTLRELYRRPECGQLFAAAFDAVRAAFDRAGEDSYRPHMPNGLPLKEWLSGAAEPSPGDLAHSLVDGICVLIWQFCLLQPHRRGSGPPHLRTPATGMLGYSLGLFAAAVAGMRIDNRREFLDVSHDALATVTLIMLRCHENTAAMRCEPDTAARYLSRFPAAAAPTPMAAILGVDVDAVRDAVAASNERAGARPVEVGIVNSPRSAVLVGPAGALAEFRLDNHDFLTAQRAHWSFLTCRTPYHGRLLGPVAERMEADWSRGDFDITGDQLALPVWGADTVRNLQSSRSVRRDFVEHVICRPLDWPAIVRDALGTGVPDGILDYGPGLGARLFTRECLQALGHRSRFDTVRTG
ncbi:MAG TPA: hypothetical protein VGR06_24790 [Actinophytocola sp.]|jgi:malonyl CoA-acyl carrier protein transacylase|uniref:hypothetical protein n=1 Tax=Actinophytocola sp. TaxID=1872138 RepID=UPI002DF8B751|nr:hypothetical protein [Actinophytocola sp.]